MINMTERTLWEGSIPSADVPATRERVDKITKRAAKKGFPAPTLTILSTEVRETTDGITGLTTGTEWSTISITADGPMSLGGWMLVGTVDELTNGKPFIRRAPGADGIDIPDSFLADPKRCDHCHTSRARLETFALSNGEKLVLVGRDCIRDFLGHDPSALIAYSLDLGSLSEGGFETSGGSAPTLFKVSDLLMLSARVASKIGYVSKAKAVEWDKPSTKERVWVWLTPPFSDADRKAKREADEAFPVDAASTGLFNTASAALDELVANGKSDNEWEASLADLWEAEFVTGRYVGYVVSAVILGLRTIERKAKVDAAPESEPLGKDGERFRGQKAVVTFLRHFEDDSYGRFNTGTRTLVKARVDDRYDIVWWASSRAGLVVEGAPQPTKRWDEATYTMVDDTYRPEVYIELEVGDTVTLDFTVKGHDVDKYTHKPVTNVTRGKITAIEKVSVAA